VRLRGCVQTLGDLQRVVVTLRMLDEVPGEDVARALGISAGHVAVILHRAKGNLLACMTTDARGELSGPDSDSKRKPHAEPERPRDH